MDKVKPFDIPKREVWEAFKKVKANQGAAGVDGQSIADFEADLTNNLYELWNRLSSGSYFPPPVRRVDTPKMDGGTRPLGIPTVADRIAQEVARRYSRSTCGWREGVLTSRLSATRMTPFVIARAPRRRRCYGARLQTVLRPASWCCIPRRRRSSTFKDANRRGDFPIISFDFLGFQFRARKTMWREGTKRIFAHSFQPAASPKALTFISRTIRRWTLHHSSDKSLPNLAEMYNPCIRGWINYYSNFYRTQLRSTLKRI